MGLTQVAGYAFNDILLLNSQPVTDFIYPILHYSSTPLLHERGTFNNH